MMTEQKLPCVCGHELTPMESPAMYYCGGVKGCGRYRFERAITLSNLRALWEATKKAKPKSKNWFYTVEAFERKLRALEKGDLKW